MMPQTQDRLLAAFKKPPIAVKLNADTRIRVMQSLGMTAAWLHEGQPKIPAARCAAYFDGAAVHADDDELLTEAAWAIVWAAQDVLLQLSVSDRRMLRKPQWLAFSKRIYDAGAALDTLEKSKKPVTLLRIKEVERRVGLSRVLISLRVKSGKFPKPVLLGDGRAQGWLESEIDEWIAQRVAQRDVRHKVEDIVAADSEGESC
jgi:prophage regulatory protein